MSYKNDSMIVILNKYGKASSAAKADLFETYDRIRDLAVAGPALGGTGSGKFFSFLTNLAQMFGSSAFSPTLGNASIPVPGTSFYSPFSGGTGILPGGQAGFGLSPYAQIGGFPGAGGAAPLDWSNLDDLTGINSINSPNGVIAGGAASLGQISEVGGLALNNIDNINNMDWNSAMLALNPDPKPTSIGGIFAGGASPIGTAATAAGLAAGTATGAGFGRNWVLPAAGIVSGLGGLLTTLGPFFGPFGIAAAAGGALMNGAAGAVLSSFQGVSQRVLNNADTMLANRVKNIETTVKQLDAQQAIIRKLLKESLDGDKKALDSI